MGALPGTTIDKYRCWTCKHFILHQEHGVPPQVNYQSCCVRGEKMGPFAFGKICLYGSLDRSRLGIKIEPQRKVAEPEIDPGEELNTFLLCLDQADAHGRVNTKNLRVEDNELETLIELGLIQKRIYGHGRAHLYIPKVSKMRKKYQNK